MKRSALALLVLLLAGCGSSTAPNPDDLRTLAGAIRSLQGSGATFTYTNTLSFTGGQIPKGQVGTERVASSGSVRGDRASFTLTRSGAQKQSFDVVLDDADIYVKPHRTSRVYFYDPAVYAEAYIEGLRLNLLRDIVLLAAAEPTAGAVRFKDRGLTRAYTITPGRDQLEQLLSAVGFQSAAEETKSLKTASGSITLYTAFGDGHLDRVEMALSGVVDSQGTKVAIAPAVIFTKLGQAAAIQVPADWIQVHPQDLFSTAQVSTSG